MKIRHTLPDSHDYIAALPFSRLSVEGDGSAPGGGTTVVPGSTPPIVTAPAVPAPAPAAAPDTKVHADLAATKAKLDLYKQRDKDKAAAAAAAAESTKDQELAKFKSELETLQGQLRRRVAFAVMGEAVGGAVRDPDPKTGDISNAVIAGFEFDDECNLTEAGKTAAAEWAKAKVYLFNVGAAPAADDKGTVPPGGAAPAANDMPGNQALTESEKLMYRGAHVLPGSVFGRKDDSPNTRAMKDLLQMGMYGYGRDGQGGGKTNAQRFEKWKSGDFNI